MPKNKGHVMPAEVPEVRFTNGELLALLAAINQALTLPRDSVHGLRVIELSQARVKLLAELELRL